MLICEQSIETRYYLYRKIGKINRNYSVTREVTDQGAQLVISVGAHSLSLLLPLSLLLFLLLH